jgi:uncharacterized protein involved in response to NO
MIELAFFLALGFLPAYLFLCARARRSGEAWRRYWNLDYFERLKACRKSGPVETTSGFHIIGGDR